MSSPYKPGKVAGKVRLTVTPATEFRDGDYCVCGCCVLAVDGSKLIVTSSECREGHRGMKIHSFAYLVKDPDRAPRVRQDRKRKYACGRGGFKAKFPKVQLRCYGCGTHFLGSNAAASLRAHQAVPA